MQSLWAHKRRHPHSAVRCNYQSQAHSTVCDPSLTANADWWPSRVKTPSVEWLSTWDMPTCQPPTLPLNFLPPAWASASLYLLTRPRDSQVFRCKAIDNLNRQAAAARLAYHSQSRGFSLHVAMQGQEIWLAVSGRQKGLGLGVRRKREERADLTQLAWLAIIAPSLSVLERPFSPYNLDTITGRLPVAVMPATPPLPPPPPTQTPPALPFGWWQGCAMPHQTRMRPINEHC